MKTKTIKFIFIFLTFIALSLIVIILIAPSSREEAYPDYILQAEVIYKNNCVMCHGRYGEGNGATVHALSISPPNWSNPNWQKSVTDEGIRLTIIEGSKFIGRSSYMPSHKHLKNTPELEGLVYLVRKFGRN